MSLSYEQFTQTFHKHFCQDPNQCISLGIHERLNELPNPSLENADQEVRDGTALLQALAEIDQESLTFDESLDLEIAELMIQQHIHKRTYTFNQKKELPQLPQASDSISGGLFMMFINDPRPASERLENIRHRVEAVPVFLEEMRQRLDTPVQRWLQMDLDKIKELPTFFSTLCNWAETEQWSGSTGLRSAVDKANQHCAQYADHLKTLPTTTSFHVGPETASEIVKLRGIELPLSELHAIAKDFLKKTQSTIDTLKLKICKTHQLPDSMTVSEVQSFLNKKFQVPVHGNLEEDILGQYEKEKASILEFNTKTQLFPILPNQDMKIISTPDFMRPSIPAGAMVSPPPFREGTRTSLIYLTLSEELRDEHTLLSIPTMMIHEGIPGHHLQLATASTHASIIRKHISAMDQAEGWTTMLEDYMLDQNYLTEHVDEARFCAKRDISRIGARVAIDLFFMTGDKAYLDVGIPCDTTSNDPFTCAGNLLQAVTGFTSGRVQAELNWYSQERGYPLSYLTGNHLVHALRRDYEASCAHDVSQRERDQLFHQIFLEAGSMPLRFLRRVFAHRELLHN